MLIVTTKSVTNPNLEREGGGGGVLGGVLPEMPACDFLVFTQNKGPGPLSQIRP